MSTRYQKPVVHHHITLKPHHKKIIIGSSTVVIILLITLSIFTYMISVRQEINRDYLEKQISDLKAESQANINTLSDSVIQTQKEIETISSDLGIVQEEFSSLQASAGEDFSGVIESSVLSVVTVKTDISQGTGFIIHKDGYIVTNYHVVKNAQAATVITYDDENHEVSLVGYSDFMDIALLKIDGSYDEINLGNSNNIQVGEKVIAIGNPLGLQFSVSQGIVSGVHRTGINGLEAYIQTDAALNPGNSGGPLINTDGEAIGINNFKVGNSESLGFALESNFIEDTVNDIYQQVAQKDLI